MSNKVAIILVNWNGYALTKDCIQSIQQSGSSNYQIVVVDNGSSDGSASMLQNDFPSIHIIASAVNLGFTGGNNLAMQWAIEQGFEYSFLLNNDTFVGPSFLEPLLSYMETYPNTGAVQPRICFAHNPSLIWNAGTKYFPWLGITKTIGYGKKDGSIYGIEKPLDWISGCAFFIRNKVLVQTGFFDPAFFTYYEDVDLSFKILNSGFNLHYIPSSIIYHIAGMSGKTITKGKEGFLHATVHYHNLRNRIWIWRRYAKFWQWPSILAYHFFYFGAMLLYFLLRNRSEKFKASINGIKDGFGPLNQARIN